MTDKNKMFEAELEKSNEEDYPTFTLTKEIIDRDGDLIKVDGIDLSLFKKNPVILFGHDHSKPAIGVWENIKKSADTITAKPKFNTGVGYELADIVAKLVSSKRIRACSISVSPDWTSLEQVPATGKKKAHMIVNKSIMNEASICNVGANQEALAKSFADGVITKSEYEMVVEPVKNYESIIADLEEEVSDLRSQLEKSQENEFEKYLENFVSGLSSVPRGSAKEQDLNNISDEELQELINNN
jgi:hypothetical protein